MRAQGSLNFPRKSNVQQQSQEEVVGDNCGMVVFADEEGINVKVKWDSGKITWLPVSDIQKT